MKRKKPRTVQTFFLPGCLPFLNGNFLKNYERHHKFNSRFSKNMGRDTTNANNTTFDTFYEDNKLKSISNVLSPRL